MVGSRRGQIVRAVTELAVIVTGVLIALSADAWYERRSDLELEGVLIRDLLAEFRINEARLRDDIRVNEAHDEAAEALLPLLTRPFTSSTVDSLTSLQPALGLRCALRSGHGSAEWRDSQRPAVAAS